MNYYTMKVIILNYKKLSYKKILKLRKFNSINSSMLYTNLFGSFYNKKDNNVNNKLWIKNRRKLNEKLNNELPWMKKNNTKKIKDKFGEKQKKDQFKLFLFNMGQKGEEYFKKRIFFDYDEGIIKKKKFIKYGYFISKPEYMKLLFNFQEENISIGISCDLIYHNFLNDFDIPIEIKTKCNHYAHEWYKPKEYSILQNCIQSITCNNSRNIGIIIRLEYENNVITESSNIYYRYWILKYDDNFKKNIFEILKNIKRDPFYLIDLKMINNYYNILYQSKKNILDNNFLMKFEKKIIKFYNH